jgi:RNA polymerase sigma factor (sigma-70 family)
MTCPEPIVTESPDELYRKHSPMIFAVVRQFAPSVPPGMDSDDLVSALNLKFTKVLKKFDASLGVQFITFLTHALINEAIDFVRNGRRRGFRNVPRRMTPAFEPSSTPTGQCVLSQVPDEPPEQDEDRATRWLGYVDQPQQRIMHLRFIHDWNVPQIAWHLQLTHTEVKQAIADGLHQVKVYLRHHPEERY